MPTARSCVCGGPCSGYRAQVLHTAAVVVAIIVLLIVVGRRSAFSPFDPEQSLDSAPGPDVEPALEREDV
jgi:hypothetical protein